MSYISGAGIVGARRMNIDLEWLAIIGGFIISVSSALAALVNARQGARKDEVTVLREACAEFSARMTQLQDKYNALQAAHFQLAQDLATTKAQLLIANSQSEQYQNQIIELTKRVEALTTRNLELENALRSNGIDV